MPIRIVLRSTLIGVAIVFAGCVRHVQLPRAPSSMAPLAERHNYYRQYRARTIDHRPVAWIGPQAIALGNGETIYATEDILPAISPSSLSAVAIRRQQEQRTYFWLFESVGLGFYCDGVPRLFSGPTSGSAGPTTEYFTSTILPLVISVGFVGLALVFERNSTHERHRALIYYNDSLRERLGLCGDGTQLEDCASAQPPTNVGRILPDARSPVVPSVAPQLAPAQAPASPPTDSTPTAPSPK